MIELGDLVSVPFNVACGRCRACRETNTGVCLTVNPGRAGGAYGYVDMGGWIGGQARYVMVPYADFNLLKFPDKDQALSKIMDLTMLTDILPTGFRGCQAGLDSVRRWRRSRRPRGSCICATPGCGHHQDRRHERSAAATRQKSRLRPDRPLQARSPR